MTPVSQQQQQSLSNNTARNGGGGGRASKTLGWFIDDALLQNTSIDEQAKNGTQNSTNSMRQKKPPAHQTLNKKDMTFPSPKLDRARVPPSNSTQPNDVRGAQVDKSRSDGPVVPNDDERKRRKYRQRASKKFTAVRSDAVGFNYAKLKAFLALEKVATKPMTQMKDAYWYYDLETDGFYYDSKDTRGWCRRNPRRVQKYNQTDLEGNPLCFNPNFAQNLSCASSQCENAFHPNPMNSPFHIQYYDPYSDGYYFEMPSVDGWKKRQPGDTGSKSAFPSPNNYGDGDILHSHCNTETEPSKEHWTYGAALAKGQMPPGSITLEDSQLTSSNMVGYEANILPASDLFSSGESTFSNLSSSDDPCSPFTRSTLDSSQMAGSFFSDDIRPDELFNQIYENFPIAPGEIQCHGNEMSIEAEHIWKSEKPLSYADAVSTSVDAENAENSPPSNGSINSRPNSLALPTFSERPSDFSQKIQKHPELTNFNADKFIADLPFISLEFALRDLSTMKTPGSTVPQLCSTNSPQTPKITHQTNSMCAPGENVFSGWQGIEDILSEILFNDGVRLDGKLDISNNTSKLDFWRNPNISSASNVSCNTD